MAKRRKKGESSVHQRKDGRWEGRVVVGYVEKGLPKTKNVLAKTKRECREKLRQLWETATTPRTEKVRPETPFGEWLDFWYQNYIKPQIRPTTQVNYKTKIYQHILPELGKIPLNQLPQKDLQQFYTWMRTAGRPIRTEQFGKVLSDSMARGLHAVCRSALEKAVQEEPRRFFIQSQAEGYYELFLLDLCTGLRRGELLALQWDDLDFKTRTLTVNKQIYGVKGQLHGSVPKTRASICRLGPAALRGGDTAALSRNGGLPVDVPLPCQRGRTHDTGGRCAGDSRSFWSGQGAKESDFTIYATPFPPCP